MKTNLKTRPELCRYIPELKIWFDAFEKELREEIKRLKADAKDAINPIESACISGCARKLEEILGDEV